MKLSLPLRIFVFHLIFMVALGALSVVLVRGTFERYRAEWERELRTVPSEELFAPLVSEVARSMLLRLDQGTSELQAAVRASIGESLDRVLPTLPSIQRLVIVDESQDVQYADDPSTTRMLFSGEAYDELLATRELTANRVRVPTGEEVIEVLIPIYREEADESNRLGVALVHYRLPSAALEAQMTATYGEGRVTGPQSWLDPWVGEVARWVLEETRADAAERLESDKQSVSEGLNQLIDALPMESLVIVDEDRRIQYVNDTRYLDLEYVGPDHQEKFAATEPVRLPVELPSGEQGVEIMLPVFEEQRSPEGGTLGRRRLGSVLVQFQPDPALLERLPGLVPSSVGLRDYLQPLILFFVVAMGGGILLAALTGLPVRRVERALTRYRERGFKGGLDHNGLPSDLANTLQTITELGGKLEALDAKGREREALLETLSHTLEDGMLAVDPSGNPVSWNPAALRILGGSAEPADAEAEGTERELLLAALERNHDLRFAVERIELRLSREMEVRLADETTSLVRMTQVPIELRDGLMGTLILLRDLAALRKVETHLLDTGRFAVLTHLGAALAHEIRNPLHAIQLNTSVVEEYATRSGRGGPVQESLVTIREETQRLTDLLNNYLGLVRASDEVGPVNLRELSQRVMRLADYVARQSNVELRLEGEEFPPPIQGVPGRLQQAILNLVLNAIQAMPNGGVVTIRHEASAGMVRLTVSDTGPGLPQDRADQLFDTRVTTKPEGSGLGLPLVRLIAEAHGGGVWYRSRPGEGTAFTLAFPLPAGVT